MQYAYVELEVGGIQNYICGSGKLKEMIGGSEIIHYLTHDFFTDVVCPALKLEPVKTPGKNGGWYLPVQTNAGIVSLVLPDESAAREFLKVFSRMALGRFPGLPLYGASTSLQIPESGGKSDYDEARRRVYERIGASRASRPVPEGMEMLPVVRAARLDGLPAVCKRNDEYLSLPSLARSDPEMLERSQKRLRGYVRPPAGISPRWADDLDEMLGPDYSRVALIRMDGNDMGKLFQKHFEGGASLDFGQRVARMRELSDIVEEVTTSAFTEAASAILRHICAADRSQSPMMPLRPLVVGGDDLTIIIREDLALIFIDLYTKAFERLSKEKKEEISVAAGMVAMNRSWPFARAFELAENLLENAKRSTLNLAPRPGSLDYAVITEEVEPNIHALRQRVYRAGDGSALTRKPVALAGAALRDFMVKNYDLQDLHSHSLLREAWTEARKGRQAGDIHYKNLLDNIRRNVGGSQDKGRITAAGFTAIFPDSFFVRGRDGTYYTELGDLLELRRLLPKTRSDFMNFYDQRGGDRNAGL